MRAGKKRISLRSPLAALSDKLPNKIDYRSSALQAPRLDIGNPFCWTFFLLSEYCLPTSIVQWVPFLE